MAMYKGQYLLTLRAARNDKAFINFFECGSYKKMSNAAGNCYCHTTQKTAKFLLALYPKCLKITQNVSFEFFNYGISTNFCPIKIDLSGNTV